MSKSEHALGPDQADLVVAHSSGNLKCSCDSVLPMSVPDTAAQGVQAVPSNLAHRIEFDTSVLMTHTQTLLPSVAPKRPAPALKDCPAPKAWRRRWTWPTTYSPAAL